MKARSISLTVSGIDRQTPLACLSELVRTYSWLEAGILYSAAPEGRNRYPERDAIAEIQRQLPNNALHVCGSLARRELMDRQLDDLINRARRIQINGAIDEDDLKAVCNRYPGHTIITQHTEARIALVRVRAPNHALLVDASGGRGIEPSRWTAPTTVKPVGFAGGLSPENLAHHWRSLQCLANARGWVDMESSLRVDDWFRIDRVKRVVEIVARINTELEMTYA